LVVFESENLNVRLVKNVLLFGNKKLSEMLALRGYIHLEFLKKCVFRFLHIRKI